MDIYGLCLSLIDITAKLARDAYKTAEDARYTKKICLALADRLEIGSRALSNLYRHRDEKDKEKFKSSNFYNSLQSYVNAATEIKRFIDEVSKLSGAMKYIKSSSHKGKIIQLVKRHDEAIADLKLGINLDEFKEIHDLQNIMETEFEKMSLIMDNIGKAKIANFSLSREYHNKSIRIKAINELIPWMAPEKLRDPDGVRYTLKSWNQEPSLRPNMPIFLTQLVTLYRNHYSPRPRSGIGKQITLSLDDDDHSLGTLSLDDVPKAAEFIRYMEKAVFLENQVALYNMGDIYYEGKLNLPKNQKRAIIYYRKAALKGHEKSIKKLRSLNISVYSKETKDEPNNGIINENKVIIDKSKDNSNDDEFKIKEILSPQIPKSPSSVPINQDSKETKDEPNNGIINENKVIIDKSKDNSNDDEFKIKEILSPQIPKSPSSVPINQDSKETKDEPNNGIINENKVIVDKSKDNEAIIDKSKDNWLGWLKKAIQNEHINFYEYSSRFKDIEKIGSGGFAKVYKAILDNSSTCALKSYKHGIANTKEITNELKLLRKVDHHQNIIRFYGVTKNESNGKYLLVLEYADSGTLRSYLQEKFESISWDLKLKFAYEIASAVLCLHENNIIHRDLHSKNFLVHQKTIKLTDFGLSRKILESATTSTFKLIGLIPYIDPQCFKHNSKPNKKSDVYSVGVLLWELTSNQPPFSNHHQQFTLMFSISQGIREEPIPNTPDEYINLYKECWQDDPESRPDIQYVETMLNGMISGPNIVDKVDKKENYGQQKNEDSNSFSHPSTISTESTGTGSLQKKFDKILDL
nr:4988_t:CDS:2 [Entrophospora candida]